MTDTLDRALDRLLHNSALRARWIAGEAVFDLDDDDREALRCVDGAQLDAMAALVREGDEARAAAVPDEVESAWLGEVLALHLANLTGRAPDDRARRALDRGSDGEFRDVFDASVHGAVCEVRARHHLRHGDPGAARELRAHHLGALQRTAAEALSTALAQVPETSPFARPEGAEDALTALRRWDQLTPDPFALSGLLRLLPKVLAADPTAATPLRDALREAAGRVAASV